MDPPVSPSVSRRLRRSVIVAVCLVAAGALSGSATPREVTRQSIGVLQLNLCNSGMAECHTGQAVTKAAAVMRIAVPDVVTLNEVCENDVYALARTLDGIHHGHVVSAFAAATSRRTGRTTRCRNGQPYGIGVLVHTPNPPEESRTYRGTYPTQGARDPENRVWLCVHAPGAFYACTTHLASSNSTVALAQCGYLLTTAIPALHAEHEYQPTVLGGDLNLRYGAAPDLQPCLPSSYRRLGDGHLQHILATADFTLASSRLIDMAGTTDHSGLLASISLPRARDRA